MCLNQRPARGKPLLSISSRVPKVPTPATKQTPSTAATGAPKWTNAQAAVRVDADLCRRRGGRPFVCRRRGDARLYAAEGGSLRREGGTVTAPRVRHPSGQIQSPSAREGPLP